MTKTSFTDPLRIDYVETPGRGGRIGMTFCPGKHQDNALTGSWARDLEEDFRIICDFGAVALVSLMEEREFAKVRVDTHSLEGLARRSGISWYHLPIVDVQVPDRTFEKRWESAGPQLHDHLAKGKNIVLHCLGGLGRTGTIAARLLVEFGLDPAKAISQVRQARPGAIETERQADYVRQIRPSQTPLPAE